MNVFRHKLFAKVVFGLNSDVIMIMIINSIFIISSPSPSSSPSPLSSSSSDELLAKVVLGLNSNEESGRAHWAAAMASPGTR